jgi:hypothetical protein
LNYRHKKNAEKTNTRIFQKTAKNQTAPCASLPPQVVQTGHGRWHAHLHAPHTLPHSCPDPHQGRKMKKASCH